MMPRPILRRSIRLLTLALAGAHASFAANVAVRTIQSAALNREINLTVVTPRSYATESARYPTIYLLHGFLEDHSSWVREMPVTASLADRHGVLLVCPDGGSDSWYLDSPVDAGSAYETHLIKEVVPYIDATCHTIAERRSRAITGLSMGGHGALFLAFRHQDLFGAAGSMAGAVDIRPFPAGANIAMRLGDYASHRDTWESHAVINQAHLLRKDSLALIIDCGVGDFLFEVNRRLHAKLLYLNIPHDYIERPGIHESLYWNSAVEYQALFFRKYFDQTATVEPPRNR